MELKFHGVRDNLQFELLLECVEDAPSSSTPDDSPTIWPNDGFIRLFLSHRFEDRALVKEVADVLSVYGVDSFVAHADIETSEEWLAVIEQSLASCDALASFITPKFKESDWCDQEVGFAHGRRCLIIPLDLGLKPYGLIGRFQSTRSLKDASAVEIASEIHDTLWKKRLTHEKTRAALFQSFLRSDSFQATQLVRKRIIACVDDFTDAEVKTLQEAVTTNHEVRDTGLPSASAWVATVAEKHQAEASTTT